MPETNLSAMHRTVASRLAPCIALRYKENGVYHEISWEQYREQADAAAVGLINRGIRQGDRVAILAENSPAWLIADIGILATGAADVPIHAPSAPDQIRYQLQHSGARGIVVSGQAQANKVLTVLEALPDLEFLVSFCPINTGGRITTLSWDGLKQSGRREGSFGLGLVAKRENAIVRDDLATIIYTSGTTGNPKGVMLSHGNLLSNAESTYLSTEFTPGDVLLSWLPYSHIYARTVDHYLTMLAGATVCMAESADTLVLNIAETQPSWMTAVPRFYEKVWSSVAALPPAHRSEALRRLFGPRLRRLSSGGAPLPKQLATGFIEAGIPLYEGYGLTESSPVISFNTPTRHKPGSVGPAIVGVEIALAEDGEVLTRGPHVMLGYWKDPESTRAAIVDGWLHTGDVGTLDAQGFLSITDRKKDLIITSGGKNIAPAELERLLTSDDMIDQAVVYGDGKPFVSALVVPNFVGLTKALGRDPSIGEDFVTDSEALEILQERIDRVMRAVSQPERIKAFLALSRPFRVEDEEMTSTLKIRRRFVIAKYRGKLDAFYAGNAVVGLDTA